MSRINRRTLLYCFGVASVSSVLPARATAAAKVSVAMPGENRFTFRSATQAKASPCKVTSEDSAGACTVFELNALPHSGPFLQVHHRVNSFSGLGARNANCSPEAASGCLAEFHTCGQTRRPAMANLS